jgi:hypothetical protein
MKIYYQKKKNSSTGYGGWGGNGKAGTGWEGTIRKRDNKTSTGTGICYLAGINLL